MVVFWTLFISDEFVYIQSCFLVVSSEFDYQPEQCQWRKNRGMETDMQIKCEWFSAKRKTIMHMRKPQLFLIIIVRDISGALCKTGEVSTYFSLQNDWQWSCPYLVYLEEDLVLCTWHQKDFSSCCCSSVTLWLGLDGFLCVVSVHLPDPSAFLNSPVSWDKAVLLNSAFVHYLEPFKF